MDLLVWPRAKVHLYLVEAANVKAAVGRDKIQRNKDALRELRCLQDILSDLHAGGVAGPPGRREAAEAAIECWARLRVAAKARGTTPEALCAVPPAMRRFLAARCPAPGAALRLGPALPGAASASEVGALSTRAPSCAGESSTAAGHSFVGLMGPDADVLSLAGSEAGLSAADRLSTDLAYGAGAAGLGERRAQPSRMSRRQLEELAARLRVQIDEEHTSLIASIDEVQALMEAEVAGAGLLPSRTEMESFCTAVAAALTPEVLPSCRTPNGKAGPVECLAEPSLVLAPAVGQAPAPAPVVAKSAVPAPLPEISATFAPTTAPDTEAPLLSPAASAKLAPSATLRPRWADFASDSDEEVLAPCDPGPAAEGVPGGRGGGNAPARAACAACKQHLGRSAFSRRAWREARRGGEATSVCLACSADVG